MSAPKAIVAPSMLSCDFSFLANEANRMCKCGADWLHMDVMDGYLLRHFVPNITIGAPVIKSLRQHTDAFLDCHMMVSNPEQWVTDFKNAGASQYTFHMEATKDLPALVRQIKAAGMKVGVGIKPKTSTEEAIARIEPVVDQVDMILVMTVEPGFGGQSFMEDMMPKVRAMRQRFPKMNIQVDGGLASDTVHKAAAAGANVIVAGTAVFKAPDPAKMITDLRNAVDVRAKH